MYFINSRKKTIRKYADTLNGDNVDSLGTPRESEASLSDDEEVLYENGKWLSPNKNV
jgi:hypothetical protein